MSAEIPNWNTNLSAKGLRVAIVVARYNEGITRKLLEGALKALEETAAESVDVFDVPGAYELPFAAKQLASRFQAIVALGAVIRGDTPHFDYVAGECARGIQQVMLETGVPIAFGVLTTENLEQAQERTGGKLGNKGYDAAMTAIEMAQFGKQSK
jgi:6,7-dimethyl-8-ribityllumazine synthase